MLSRCSRRRASHISRGARTSTTHFAVHFGARYLIQTADLWFSSFPPSWRKMPGYCCNKEAYLRKKPESVFAVGPDGFGLFGIWFLTLIGVCVCSSFRCPHDDELRIARGNVTVTEQSFEFGMIAEVTIADYP